MRALLRLDLREVALAVIDVDGNLRILHIRPIQNQYSLPLKS